jgi:hypothetical protein
MGQQQLLLLVLGIVIVGLAVVVGIGAFGENRDKSNADSLISTGVRIANHMQAWTLTHAAFGGPTAGEDIGDATYEDIHLPHTAGVYSTPDGSFTLSPGTGCMMITAVGIGSPNSVYVLVTGTAPEDVTAVLNPITAPSCS